ncbi:Ubiquitin carboxyl-terminal hydrolase family protein [Rhynchospora pubera]|uniref:Ubiquitin carboxyl-terminal hydrolase family protein n=1 Tax=Rhynchospora pubera TaxID=906938 RepID=A0AAV8E4K6_9POAL|nr:Ubiquitin carboxyl-terminal hydrolase family protein [Rhynchospora pubera]
MPLSPSMACKGILSRLKPLTRTHVQSDSTRMMQQHLTSSYRHLFLATQIRHMTRHRRVKDRSKKKRIHHLEIVTERYKVVAKVLAIIEILKKEQEQVMPLRQLEKYRQQINLPKPYKVADFIRKSPKLFEICKDTRGALWCGLTSEAEELMEEETKLLELNNEKTVEYVTRLLMMSVEKKLPVDKIAHFRRDMGLPNNFRTEWVHMFPEHFKLVRMWDTDFLELVNWNPKWAVTELEKKSMATKDNLAICSPGELCLPFPMKFPPDYKRVFQYKGQIENFQKMAYLSPYADARGLTPGTREFDKRTVAIIHEILSFTLEKRLVTDHLTHFRRELVMPQKLMRILLKHFGVFYVSERGKRFSVFLNEAYNGSELVDKVPLVLWREKVLQFTGYRGRIKKIIDSDTHAHDDADDDAVFMDDGDEEMSNPFNDDDSEMDVATLHI